MKINRLQSEIEETQRESSVSKRGHQAAARQEWQHLTRKLPSWEPRSSTDIVCAREIFRTQREFTPSCSSVSPFLPESSISLSISEMQDKRSAMLSTRPATHGEYHDERLSLVVDTMKGVKKCIPPSHPYLSFSLGLSANVVKTLDRLEQHKHSESPIRNTAVDMGVGIVASRVIGSGSTLAITATGHLARTALNGVPSYEQSVPKLESSDPIERREAWRDVESRAQLTVLQLPLEGLEKVANGVRQLLDSSTAQ